MVNKISKAAGFLVVLFYCLNSFGQDSLYVQGAHSNTPSNTPSNTLSNTLSNTPSNTPSSIPVSYSGILWDSEFYSRSIETYKRAVPIRFEGVNSGEKDIRILSVKADCASCLVPKASLDVVRSGERVSINAILRLVGAAGIQRGRVVVETCLDDNGSMDSPQANVGAQGGRGEGYRVYTLSYQVSFNPPYGVSPTALLWDANDTGSRDIEISFDRSLGYEYKNFETDNSLYKVEVIEKGDEVLSGDLNGSKVSKVSNGSNGTNGSNGSNGMGAVSYLILRVTPLKTPASSSHINVIFNHVEGVEGLGSMGTYVARVSLGAG